MRWRAALVAVALVASGVLVPASPVGAIDLVSVIGRPVVQTIAMPFRRGADYRTAERRRDANLADIAAAEAAKTAQHDRGWIDDETYQRSMADLASLREIVPQRAEREKQVARHDWNRAVGDEWVSAAENALVGLATADARTAGAITAVLRGRSPLQVALDRLVSQPVTTYDELAEVQAKLDEAKAVRRALRDPSGVLEAGLGQLESILAANVPANRGQPLPPEFLEAYRVQARRVQERLQTLTSQAGGLLGTSVRVDDARFARDARWAAYTDAIMQAGGIPVANRLPLATMAPRVGARVDELAAGRNLTAEQRNRVVLSTLAWYLSVVQQRASRVPNPPTFDLDESIRLELDRVAPEPTTTTSHDDAAEWADRKASREPEPGEQLVVPIAPPFLSDPWGQLMASSATGSVNAQVASASGQLVVDFDSGAVTGEIAVTFDCGEGNCQEAGTFAEGQATLVFTGTATPSASPLSVWDLSGTAQVTASGRADHCGGAYPCPYEGNVSGSATFTGAVSKGLFDVQLEADHQAETGAWFVSFGTSVRITEDVPGPVAAG